MKIVFMGTPEFSANVLAGLIEKYDVSLVVSQPDKPVGRKKEIVSSPVVSLARKHNIDVFQPEKIKNDYQKIVDVKPDLIITCAYGQIISEDILKIPRLGCINVHASILPKYRGGAPIHRAIINGDDETGVTIMYMDKGMDTGDIISVRKMKIETDDNLEEVFNKLSDVGRSLLLDTLPSIIDGKNERIPQNNLEATYAYNIQKEETKLDFNDTALNIYNKIRGLSPWIGAYCIFNGENFKVYASRIGEKVNKKPGVVANLYKDGFGVCCSDREIIFTEVQAFGKKKMDARSFMNGVNILGEEFK